MGNKQEAWTRQRRLLAVVAISGGTVGWKLVKTEVKRCLREQAALFQNAEAEERSARTSRPKVAVNGLFFRRIRKILSICVPGAFSVEAGLIYLQGCLLISRTYLTDSISQIEATAGQHLISQNFPEFGRGLATFAALAIPAATVNSGLKYMQTMIQLAFMKRLSHHLHNQYCNNRAYYSASQLKGLTHPDQRLTEDVEKFCYSISELYSYTFKPLLDVLLFTRSLAAIMGYKSQFVLYGYYFLSAIALRKLSPPLALMTAQEAALAGSYRNAHQRLVANAEEVAFNDPPSGAAEQLILNQRLYRVLRYSHLSAFLRFIQQVFDQYIIKYFASVVALLVYAAPVYLNNSHRSMEESTQDYIRAMRLLQNTSKGVGDLVLVYKRVTTLAGYTSRVSELLETVDRLSRADDTQTRELYLRNVSSSETLSSYLRVPESKRILGSIIKFNRVALNAPDGSPLVRDLSFEVPPGCSVLIMGPNGSGKSSLLRVLAGLWPLQGGEITVPSKPGSMFYISQRPYLVAGTLRDQMLYPLPPRAVWATASEKMKQQFAYMPAAHWSLDEIDERLSNVLEKVDLEYLLARGKGWEQVQNWNETLSGGEKQRLAMARLLFHEPTYAILDECTSAVSADGEVDLYKACHDAGITMLSIGHRPAIRSFHDLIVHFEGAQHGRGWHMEDLRSEQILRESPEEEGI